MFLTSPQTQIVSMLHFKLGLTLAKRRCFDLGTQTYFQHEYTVFNVTSIISEKKKCSCFQPKFNVVSTLHFNVDLTSVKLSCSEIECNCLFNFNINFVISQAW